MTEIMYFEPEEIEEVNVVWNEEGHKRIEVSLKNGEKYVVESDK